MLRIFAIFVSFLAGNVAYAASFKRLIEKTIDEIIDPLIIVIFGIATLYFLWGVAEFIGKAGDEKGREEGKQKIIWGLIGLAIMVGVYGIVDMISDFFLDVNGGGSGIYTPINPNLQNVYGPDTWQDNKVYPLGPLD